MAAGGAGVSVAMIMKPFHLRSCAVRAFDQFLPGLAFLFCKAHGGLNVEPGAGQQVSRQDFLRHMVYDGFLDKPRASFDQRPFPEIRMKRHGSCGLKIGCPQRIKQRVGFRDDIKGQFIIDDVPGCSGRPAGGFIIPGPLGSPEVIIPEPLDAAG